MLQERLGYIDGGSELLLEQIAERLPRARRHDRAARPASSRCSCDDSRRRAPRRGVRVAGAERRFDAVVSTIPLPYLVPLIPDLPADEKARIAAIRTSASSACC